MTGAAEDPRLTALRKSLLERLEGRETWQIRTASGHWICPYCTQVGARWPDATPDGEPEPTPILDEVIGHLTQRCRSFQGGKGRLKHVGRLREVASIHDLHAVVRSDDRWATRDAGGRWYCPVGGTRQAFRIESHKPTVGELGRIQRHLGRCSACATAGRLPTGVTTAAGAARGATLLPAATLRVSVRLHTDPAYRHYDLNRRWVDPFTLTPTDIHLPPDRRIDREQIEATAAYLERSTAYRLHGGVPPHSLAEIESAVRRGNRRLQLTALLRRLVPRDPVWSVTRSTDGRWACPFCRESVEGVDVSHHRARLDLAPRQIARHLVEACPAFDSGVDPVRTAAELDGTSALRTQTIETNDETPVAVDRSSTGAAPYEASLAALESLLDDDPDPRAADDPARAPDADLMRLDSTSDVRDQLLAVRPDPAAAAAEHAKQEEHRRTLEKAREVQLGMLPPPPTIEGLDIDVLFRGCEEVSGDFYDFVKVSPNELGIVVGDVSGHGVHAGLVMAAAKQALKIHGRGEHSPAKALETLQDDLRPELPPGIFVTIWYGILDLERGILRHVRAGHNPLLVVGREGLRVYEPGGMIVGMAPTRAFAASLVEEEIQLAPGELVVQYTDGITEAMNGSRDEYGDDQLRVVVSAHATDPLGEILKAVDADVDRFRAGAEPNDDVTLLAFRWSGQPTLTALTAALAAGPPPSATTDLPVELVEVATEPLDELPGAVGASELPEREAVVDDVAPDDDVGRAFIEAQPAPQDAQTDPFGGLDPWGDPVPAAAEATVFDPFGGVDVVSPLDLAAFDEEADPPTDSGRADGDVS